MLMSITMGRRVGLEPEWRLYSRVPGATLECERSSAGETSIILGEREYDLERRGAISDSVVRERDLDRERRDLDAGTSTCMIRVGERDLDLERLRDCVPSASMAPGTLGVDVHVRLRERGVMLS